MNCSEKIHICRVDVNKVCGKVASCKLSFGSLAGALSVRFILLHLIEQTCEDLVRIPPFGTLVQPVACAGVQGRGQRWER